MKWLRKKNKSLSRLDLDIHTRVIMVSGDQEIEMVLVSSMSYQGTVRVEFQDAVSYKNERTYRG